MNILNVEKVSKTFGDRTILDEVVLGVNQGDRIGVVGVNGTGKSTFLKIIAGIEEADSGAIVKGRGVKVSYLEQEPPTAVGETVIEYVSGKKTLMSGEVIEESQAKSILNKLGITEFDALMENLSGGQKRKVALARTIALPCDVLILDEPTNHLDHEMIIWLESYIKKFKGELILVTHDRYFLDNVTNRIVEIDNAKLYSYETNYSGFLEAKTAREEMEVASERKRTSILRTELEWIKRGCKARSTKQQARIDRYEDLKEASRIARAGFEKANLEVSSVFTRLGKKTLEAHGISKSFGDKCVVNNYEYYFLRDDRIGIVGPNGCGKSTLVKMLCGRLAPDSGFVEKGETVKLGVFSQENEIGNGKETVLEFVKNIGEYVLTTQGRISASQMCERFLFNAKKQWTAVEKLSGGEKRRLYLLSVLMTCPNVLVLDEPTNDLDIETLEILEDYLDQFAGIVIVVSHDRYFLDRVVDRIFSFEGDGNIFQYEGGFSDYYEKYQAKCGSLPVSSVSESSEKTPKASYINKHENKVKFTYAEQKEFEKIDDEIAKLEDKIADVESQIAKAATDFSKLTELTNLSQKLNEELEFKMERWVYLNEIAEKIQNG